MSRHRRHDPMALVGHTTAAERRSMSALRIATGLSLLFLAWAVGSKGLGGSMSHVMLVGFWAVLWLVRGMQITLRSIARLEEEENE